VAKRGKLGRKPERSEIMRPTKWRYYRRFVLIVCEDEKTERIYFEQFEKYFPANTVFLRVVGTGLSPLGVVERTISEAELLRTDSNKEVDEKWAVFDKDDADLNATTITNFNRAFEIADAFSVQTAWSNEAFELWLLLHFKDVDPETPLDRKEIYERLERAAQKHPAWKNFVYKHGASEIIECVAKIGNEQQAMQRAKRLDEYFNGKGVLESNPCTKVYHLINRLRDLINWYQYEPGK
jgi:RloB-like protein